MNSFENEFSDLINQMDISLMKFSKNILSSGFKKNSNSSCNISERQFHILYMIKNRNINTTSTLAKFFDLSKSNISIIVSKLEALDCLRKIYDNDKKDGRNVFFEVTEKGNEYLELHISKLESERSIYFSKFITEEIQKEFYEIITLVCNYCDIEVNKDKIFETILLLNIIIKTYVKNVFSEVLKELDLNISRNDCHILCMMCSGLNTCSTCNK